MTEWKTYRLGDVIDKVIDNRGKSAPTSEDKYQPIIEINSLGGRTPDYTVVRKWVSEETYNTWFRSGHPIVGDILIPTVGTIGIVSMMDENRGCIAQNVVALRVKSDVCGLFIYYYLKSDIVRQQLLNLNIGGVQPSIKVPHLLNLEISLPSLEEQRRIAGILGAIDDKIENNRRINTNLELQAQALFDNLMSNSNLEYKLIVDIDHIIETGRRPKGGVANITSGVPSIGAENIKGLGKYDYSKTKYITAEFAETLKKGIIKGYELLIYKDGGKPGYFIPNFSIFGEGFPYDNMTLNEHVFLLDFGNKGYNFFAYFYMQTEEVMKYLNAQGSKAAIPGINRNDVENISIPTIENEAVKEFCERIEPIITSILVNSKESSRLATLRDTLLPKLMNGEIKTE